MAKPVVTYDREADAVYIDFGAGKVVQSFEAATDMVLDLDATGRVLGVEVTNASRRLASGSWLEAPPPHARNVESGE